MQTLLYLSLLPLAARASQSDDRALNENGKRKVQLSRNKERVFLLFYFFIFASQNMKRLFLL